MKYFLFVCEGLTDEPLEDLGGRTPLEAAKTPVLDALAQKGRARLASFAPANLEPTRVIANLSLLGYDPQKYYTGLAPLEAVSFGIDQADNQVIFRADLVTLLDEALIDPFSGTITEREAGTLIKGLIAKYTKTPFEFQRGSSYKNYLLVRDEKLLEDLDELDCVPPSYCLGQKVSKHLPKGRGSEAVIQLMNEVSAYLESHEINRVRIDLGENPANRLWLWGQGKKPRLPQFEKEYGLNGAFFTSSDLVRGIAKTAGLTGLRDAFKVPAQTDFVYFHSIAGIQRDLKAKIKKIEDFDMFVGSILKHYEKEPVRIAIAGDLAESLPQKKYTRNPTLVLTAGEGITPEKNTAFNEKACGQSASIEKGHEFLRSFLK